MLRREVDPFISRWRRGDAEARAYLLSLFGPFEPCLDCDRPIGHGDYVPIFIEDRQSPAFYIVAPRCMPCSRLPDSERRGANMLGAMFPGGQWRRIKPKRDEVAGYLRGGPAKRRVIR